MFEPYDYKGTFYRHTLFGNYYEKSEGEWISGVLNNYKNERKDGTIIYQVPKENNNDKNTENIENLQNLQN